MRGSDQAFSQGVRLIFKKHYVPGIVMCLCAAGCMCAGVTGSIGGTVEDPTDAAVPFAQITVTNLGSGAVLAIASDGSGQYIFPGLPAGEYRLDCTASGFSKYRLPRVRLNAGGTLRLDIALRIGTATETVEVSAISPHVDTSTTQEGDAVVARTMEALPLNGRSYTDLMALQPGVVPVSAGTLPGSITLGGSIGSGNVSISGSRESANAFEVNGAEVEEPRLNGTAVVPNLDSIAEFRIGTSGAGAEFGHYSGALVNVVTKSGTNDVHGSAFEFLRNEKLDARNFFDNQRGRFQRNQFGGGAGGPVLRNRIFFYIDYQGTREARGLTSGEVRVPSMAERGGDFSGSAGATLSGAVGGGNFASSLTEKLGYAVAVGEPYYVPGCVSNSRCVFPNGIIPQRAFAQPSKSLLQFIPLPTDGSFYKSSANKNVLHDDLGGVRLDGNTAAGTLSVYASANDSALSKQFGDNNVPGFPTSDNVASRHVSAGYTRTFGPRTANELNASLTRYVVASDSPDAGVASGMLHQLGFNNADAGGMFSAAPALEGVPPISFSDFTIGTPQFVYNAYETTTQVRDSLSLVRNRHALKFGAEHQFTNFVDRFPLLFGNGAFTFSGAETGNDFADFLIGAPTSFMQQSNVDADERKSYVGAYGEDSWRVASTLTLNFGIRWEYLPSFRERSNQKATFAQGVQSSVFPGAPTGLLYVGDQLPGFGKIPPTINRTPLRDFAPRLGAAYSPSFQGGLLRTLFGTAGSSSIRASYGIYYTTIEGIGAYFSDPPVPFTSLYVSASPPYFPDPYLDRSSGTQHANPFPGSPVRPGNGVSFAQFEPVIGVPGTSVHNVTPYSEKYSLSVQRYVKGSALVSLAYIGAQGHHLLATLPNNPGNAQRCLALGSSANVAAGSAVCGPFGEDSAYTTASGQQVQGTRSPFGGPNFGDNSDVATIANSSYNALQASLRFRSDHLNVLAAYTYSKSLDDSSAFDDAPLNPFNYRLSRSLSAFDLAHDLVVSYVYDLPVHGTSRLLSGWQLAGISRFATGLPVTLYENDDRSLLGLFGSGVGLFLPIDEPNYNGGGLKFRNPRSGSAYFDTSEFSPEPLGQLGTANRRFFHGPGIENFDVALLKDTKLGERVTAQFRAEFFNILNHAQFLNPVGNFSDAASFGRVIAARDPRIGQLAVKLLF